MTPRQRRVTSYADCECLEQPRYVTRQSDAGLAGVTPAGGAQASVRTVLDSGSSEQAVRAESNGAFRVQHLLCRVRGGKGEGGGLRCAVSRLG